MSNAAAAAVVHPATWRQSTARASAGGAGCSSLLSLLPELHWRQQLSTTQAVWLASTRRQSGGGSGGGRWRMNASWHAYLAVGPGAGVQVAVAPRQLHPRRGQRSGRKSGCRAGQPKVSGREWRSHGMQQQRRVGDPSPGWPPLRRRASGWAPPYMTSKASPAGAGAGAVAPLKLPPLPCTWCCYPTRLR